MRFGIGNNGRFSPFGIQPLFGSSTPPPAAPVAAAATNVTDVSFSANWAASVGATGYYLDVSTSAVFASFVPGYENLDVFNVTTYSVTGLTANINYYYRVRAFNAGGTSGDSNTISTNTLAPFDNFSAAIFVASLIRQRTDCTHEVWLLRRSSDDTTRGFGTISGQVSKTEVETWQNAAGAADAYAVRIINHMNALQWRECTDATKQKKLKWSGNTPYLEGDYTGFGSQNIHAYIFNFDADEILGNAVDCMQGQLFTMIARGTDTYFNGDSQGYLALYNGKSIAPGDRVQVYDNAVVGHFILETITANVRTAQVIKRTTADSTVSLRIDGTPTGTPVVSEYNTANVLGTNKLELFVYSPPAGSLNMVYFGEFWFKDNIPSDANGDTLASGL